MTHIALTESTIEKFKYWKKFLYRSIKYKTICTLIQEKKSTVPFDNKLIDFWCPVVQELNNPYADWLHKAFNGVELNDLFNSLPIYHNMIKYIYPLFGDIFNNNSFDPILRRIKLFYELYEASPVTEADNKIRSFIDIAESDLKKYGIEHSIGFTFTTSFLEQESKGFFDNLICIDLNLNTETIVKELRIYIESLREKANERLEDQIEFGKEFKSHADRNIASIVNHINIYFPSGYNKSENFDNYITAHDLTKQLGSADESYKVIYGESGTIDKSDNPQWRKHKKYIKNAELYIRNAEFGIFPGRIRQQERSEQKSEPISRPEFESIAHLVNFPQKRGKKGKAKKFPLESYFPNAPQTNRNHIE